MPNRVVRGDINSSESLSHVSLGADLTFRALILVVDDYGRFDARPDALKAALFPMRPMATKKKIMGWIEELARDGCVQLYEAGGRPYLALTGWETHRGNTKRGQSSKFPDPQDSPDPQDIRSGVGGGVGVGGGEGEKSEAAPRLALEETLPFTERHPKLINLLASQEGDPAEKRAWLNDEGPVIEAEVEAGTGAWKVVTIRYYRRYLQGRRKHQHATRDAKIAKAARAAEEADRAAAHAS